MTTPDIPAEAQGGEKGTTGLDYVPWNGVHEFRPWTVMHRNGRSPWIAPGCSCGTIRSAGPSDESEASMLAWFEGHLTRATVAHEFEAFDGATGRACTRMVERGGYGEDCGLPPGAHVTPPAEPTPPTPGDADE